MTDPTTRPGPSPVTPDYPSSQPGDILGFQDGVIHVMRPQWAEGGGGTFTFVGYTGEDGLTQPDEPADILDRIDQALAHSYDAQTSTGQPWPFRGF